MYWEQIAFCLFTAGYLMLSSVKTIDKFILKIRTERYLRSLRKDNNGTEANGTSNNTPDANKHHHHTPLHRHLTPLPPKPVNQRIKYFKLLLNYCVAFNSSFLIVGSLSESYFYGVRMVGNMLSVSLGYVYAFFLVVPLMISLDESIKTPYQYFERRYGNRKYVRAITAAVGMFFYLSFLTLYVWGCSNLLSTLIPQIPLYVSSIILGLFSTMGSTIGGFTQSTKTNLFQFLILITGLVTAIVFTIMKFSDSMDLSDIYYFEMINQRTKFFDTTVDIFTRYTILNQSISLSIPWACIHALLLPNFMRYRSIKGSALKKRLTVISNFPFMILVNTLVLIGGGIICYIFFYGCDPLSAKKIENKNQTGTFWLYSILTVNAPSFTGILFSSIMCYSLVQHSLGISLCANTIYNEILNPMALYAFKLSDHMANNIKIGLTVFLGLVSIAYAVSFQFVKNTALAMFFLFNNSTNSPILGLYFLSAFNPYANHVGAMSAFVLNLAINYFWGLGALQIYSNLRSQEFPQTTGLCNKTDITNLTEAAIELKNYYNSINQTDNLNIRYYPENPVLFSFYRIAPIWYCLWSVLFTFIMGSLLSLIYSLIKTRSFDADSKFKQERKDYLFYYLYMSK